MTVYQVLFTAEAEADLDEIHDFIARSSGESRARSVISSLVKTCLDLDLFPHRGTLRDDVAPGLRVIAHRDWASIAFTVENSTVTIEGILWRGRNTGNVIRRGH